MPLKPLGDKRIPRDTIEEVVLRRGSSRRFRRKSIRLAQFATILDRSTRGIAADFLTPFGARLNDLYLIVHAVEGLLPGAYFYHGTAGGLERLKHGQFRDHAAHLALDQNLAGDAAAGSTGDISTSSWRTAMRGAPLKLQSRAGRRSWRIAVGGRKQ